MNTFLKVWQIAALGILSAKASVQRASLSWIAAMVLLGPVAAYSQDSVEKEKIEALITHVEGLKGATFVRGRKTYDAASAVKFLRLKWDSKRAEVKTAGEFIRKIATVSSTTGQPYLMRMSDGNTVPFGEYLTRQLQTLEANPAAPSPSPSK
jgi:hypothetical protein